MNLFIKGTRNDHFNPPDIFKATIFNTTLLQWHAKSVTISISSGVSDDFETYARPKEKVQRVETAWVCWPFNLGPAAYNSTPKVFDRKLFFCTIHHPPVKFSSRWWKQACQTTTLIRSRERVLLTVMFLLFSSTNRCAVAAFKSTMATK